MRTFWGKYTHAYLLRNVYQLFTTILGGWPAGKLEKKANSDKFCLTGAWAELWKMYCLIPFNPPMLYFGVLHLTFWGTPTIRMLRVRTLKMQAFKDEWLLGWMCTDTGSEEVLVELCSFWLGNSYLNIRLPFLLFWFMSPMTNDTVFCRWSWRYWCLFWLLEHKYHLPAS